MQSLKYDTFFDISGAYLENDPAPRLPYVVFRTTLAAGTGNRDAS